MRPTALLAGALVAACTRSTDGAAGSPAPSATTAATSPSTTSSAVASASASASAAASASAPFTAPTLHAVTCPPAEPSPASEALPGCEHCPPGQYCRRFDVHGNHFGTCAKNECRGDADCKGALCNCTAPTSCYPGNCRSSADCGGRECVPDRWRYGHGSGIYCRTDRDTCKTHADCTAQQECAYLGDHWGCRPTTPAPPPG
jgi:hypothetical protein